MLDRELAIAVLRAVGVAEAAQESFEGQTRTLAADIGVSASDVDAACRGVFDSGLALIAVDPEQAFDPPMLLNAGKQYLARDGNVDRWVLKFLPRHVDDLNAREALLAAGTVMVDEFAYAIARDGGVEHAQEIVPAAFAGAVTPRLVLDLYAAAVALLVRLSADEPAGCVAEEVMAVELMSQAEAWLDGPAKLSEDAVDPAKAALRGIFALFDDDDVLDLFEMSEPADAAVAGHSAIAHQMGRVDQRLEAWFRPFSGVVVTGHVGT